MNKEVKITNSSIQKLTNINALSALSEGIWNAIDSDATEINIETFKDDITSKLIKIQIKDNGKGIPFSKFDEYFTLFQHSWKKYVRRENNKLYHGKNGEGRFKLLSISSFLNWETSYLDNTNKIKKYDINCSGIKPKTFNISDKVVDGFKTGTTLTLSNLTEKATDLNTNSLYYNLISIFALYLESESNLTIKLNGIELDPTKFIKEDEKGSFIIKLNDDEIPIEYRFIAWVDDFKYTDKKHTYLFDKNYNYVIEKPSGVAGNIIPHSVFLISDYFHNFDGLFEETDNKINKIRNKYHSLLLTFLFDVRRKYSREEFQKFIGGKYYPFQNKPIDKFEEAQKELFDLCSFKILETDNRLLSKKENSLNILFKLLQKVIEKDENIGSIITEVLDLNEEDSISFKNIIETSSLPKLISYYHEIKEKLIFIDVLETLVHEDFYKKNLKERTQLHKIVEQETWIFGDQFSENIGTSDQSLKRVILENFKINNKEEKKADELIKNLKAEKNNNLLNTIPDLYLWNDFPSNNGQIINNLIVELKAPKVKISYKELEQINKYRRGIMNNKCHRVTKHNTWTYYVISSDMDTSSTFKSEFDDYEKGIVFNKEGMKVYVKTWENIIKSRKKDLYRLKKDLEIQIEEKEKTNLLNKYLEKVDF